MMSLVKLDDRRKDRTGLLLQVRLHNGNRIDCSRSVVFTRRWGLGIFSLASLDRETSKQTYGDAARSQLLRLRAGSTLKVDANPPCPIVHSFSSSRERKWAFATPQIQRGDHHHGPRTYLSLCSCDPDRGTMSTSKVVVLPAPNPPAKPGPNIPPKGLTSDEAKSRLQKGGPNAMPDTSAHPLRNAERASEAFVSGVITSPRPLRVSSPRRGTDITFVGRSSTSPPSWARC